MTIHLPQIPLKTYRFNFIFEGSLKLPKYPGSAWRGAFGRALKKAVCVVKNTPCSDCLLKAACAYPYLFETQPPAHAEKLRNYQAIPHPFVLQFPFQVTQASGHYALDIILFGHGQRFLPYIIHALQQAGQDGIGGHRQNFTLLTIEDIDSHGLSTTIYQGGELKPQPVSPVAPMPAMPEHITISFYTPLRIKQDGKNTTPRELSFSLFFNTLLRRISSLSYFHTDTPLTIDFAAITRASKTVDWLNKKLQWYDWTRYSSRQETEMQMGGLIGQVQLAMTGLEQFWPFLWIGQWTHVGKGTSMGMGAYRIEGADLSTSLRINP